MEVIPVTIDWGLLDRVGSDGDHPHDSKDDSAHHLSLYKEGSDRFHRGLMEVIPLIREWGLIDLVGV